MCCPCVPFFLKSGPDLAQILAPNAALSSTPAQILAPNAALSSTPAQILAPNAALSSTPAQILAPNAALSSTLALILAPNATLSSTPAPNAGPPQFNFGGLSFQLRRLKLNSFFSPFSL
jgi:hypothetical protein